MHFITQKYTKNLKIGDFDEEIREKRKPNQVELWWTLSSGKHLRSSADKDGCEDLEFMVQVLGFRVQLQKI